MIPGPGLLVALLAWAGAGVLAALWPDLRALWLAAALVLLAIAWIDLRAVLRRACPEVTRSVPGSLALDVWNDVVVHLRAPDEQPLRAAVFDHHPQGDDDIAEYGGKSMAGPIVHRKPV